MNDVPDRGGFYEEDPYFRTEREDPTDEDRRESLVDCLIDIARTQLTVTADDLAAVTRDAEIDLQVAKEGVLKAQDFLIKALQDEIDFMEGE